MRQQMKIVVVAGALVFSVSGCKAVKIVQPASNIHPSHPVAFEVEFHRDADRSTFEAMVDGTLINWDGLGRYSAASQGSYSGGTPMGTHELKVAADWSRTVPFGSHNPTRREYGPPAVTYDHSGGNRRPSRGGFGVARGSSTSSSSGGGGASIAGGGSYGRPPTDLHVKETETEMVTVLLPSAPSSPVTVTLWPSNNYVSINGSSAGAWVPVTIPTNDRRVTFRVRGIQAGNTIIRATTDGYQEGRLSVLVWN